MARRTEFDEAYYDRFYRDRRRRVASPAETARLVGFIAGYLKFLRISVRSALDLGCGTGPWRRPLARAFPSARYRGVERSEYACARYGWERGSVVDYAGRPADLVICQGVLQYLPPRDAARAIENLARLARRALYLEVLTEEDWAHGVDRARTDGAVLLRPAAWYRSRLRRRFDACGGGLFVPRGTAPLFELERGA